MTGEADEYVAARSALLDALTALEPHLDAFVLVGAQAIYLRVGEADVAVPGSTTDGDIAIDPALLHDAPIIPVAMERAHFRLREERPGVMEPGIWELGVDGPTVDLLVPRSLRPLGRRGARLGIHGNRAAKTVPGWPGHPESELPAIARHESADSHVVAVDERALQATRRSSAIPCPRTVPPAGGSCCDSSSESGTPPVRSWRGKRSASSTTPRPSPCPVPR